MRTDDTAWRRGLGSTIARIGGGTYCQLGRKMLVALLFALFSTRLERANVPVAAIQQSLQCVPK